MNASKRESTAIKRHTKVIRKLEEDRIISMMCRSDGFYILEMCDEYFSHKLTKEECMDLSEFFAEISSEISKCKI